MIIFCSLNYCAHPVLFAYFFRADIWCCAWDALKIIRDHSFFYAQPILYITWIHHNQTKLHLFLLLLLSLSLSLSPDKALSLPPPSLLFSLSLSLSQLLKQNPKASKGASDMQSGAPHGSQLWAPAISQIKSCMTEINKPASNLPPPIWRLLIPRPGQASLRTGWSTKSATMSRPWSCQVLNRQDWEPGRDGVSTRGQD